MSPDSSGELRTRRERILKQVELLDKYRTGPLSFPLHVVDDNGDALCGNLTYAQERFIEQEGTEALPTLRKRLESEGGGAPALTFLGSLCGNCRRSLFTKDGTEELEDAEQEFQRRMPR
jgi:hypothetical protein